MTPMTSNPYSKHDFTEIGALVQKTLKSVIPEKNREVVQIWEIWDQTVGFPICDETRPDMLKDDALIVYVSNSAWIHHLSFCKAELIDKLNKALGKKRIRDIIFKVGAL